MRLKKFVKLCINYIIYGCELGHPGGSLSATDIMSALYFDELNVNGKVPKWADRDRLVLSKGHVCPVLYSCLAMRNYFPYETIYTLRQEGSILQGHPDMKRCPGIDISTGSLGQGLSCAVGMAIAGKRDKKDYRVFAIIGDGESNEGQIWEALESASKYQLDNLIIILDQNRLQNDNICEVVMPSLDMVKKFEAFGMDTQEIDGHNMNEITTAFDNIRNSDAKNLMQLLLIL
ncbi:MAG: transketolase [Spirochaetaceae bacterium]|nr:transketolase [Spirochaetaceae bacterium]